MGDQAISDFERDNKKEKGRESKSRKSNTGDSFSMNRLAHTRELTRLSREIIRREEKGLGAERTRGAEGGQSGHRNTAY